MKKNIEKFAISLCLIPMAFCGIINADQNVDVASPNIQVGSRTLSVEQRASLANLRQQEAASDIQEEDQFVAKASLFKKFYQLHYSAFHHGKKAAADGSTLELDDGSIWALQYVSDMLSVMKWTSKDSLVIEQWDLNGVEYKILNQTRDESIIVTPILGPIYSGVYTHWVVSRDTLFGTVKLEDGSEWEAFSSSSFNLWQPNDTIIVGAYEFGSVYNTILINVNLLDYARVKLKWVK